MNKITGFVLAILIGGMVSGCSSENRTPQNINLQPLSITNNLNIPLNDPNILIGDFSGLAVDRKGVIYVADTKLQKVHLISPKGQYLDSLGRKGKGPGEFMWMDFQIEIQSDTLYVMDRENWRITMFNQGHLYIGSSDSLLLRKYDGHGRAVGTLQGAFLCLLDEALW